MHGVDKPPESRELVGVGLRLRFGAGAGGGEAGFAGIPSPASCKAAARQDVAQIKRDDDDADGDGGPQQHTGEIAASQGSDPLATAAFGNAVCRSSEETMPLDNSAKSGLAGVGADCANALAPEPSAKARPRASHTGGKIKTLARSPLARVAILSVRRFTMPYPVCGDVTSRPSLRRRRRFQRASGQTRNHSAHAGGNQAMDFPYFTDEPLAASLRPSMRELFPTGQSAQACAENASPSLRGSAATKIPWGVDSGRSCCQTEVAIPPTLEMTDVT
jgi:hypothetical protein